MGAYDTWQMYSHGLSLLHCWLKELRKLYIIHIIHVWTGFLHIGIKACLREKCSHNRQTYHKLASIYSNLQFMAFPRFLICTILGINHKKWIVTFEMHLSGTTQRCQLIKCKLSCTYFHYHIAKCNTGFSKKILILYAMKTCLWRLFYWHTTIGQWTNTLVYMWPSSNKPQLILHMKHTNHTKILFIARKIFTLISLHIQGVCIYVRNLWEIFFVFSHLDVHAVKQQNYVMSDLAVR